MGHPLPTATPAMLTEDIKRLAEDIERLTRQRDQLQLKVDRMSHIAGEYRAASTVTPNGSDREGWLRTRLRGGAGLKTALAGETILASRANDEPMRSILVEALHDMLDEQERWKDAWSSVTVEKDHAVIDAMRRSASCEHHGTEIRELEAQLLHAEARERRAERGRISLIESLFELERAVDKLDLDHKLGRATPDDHALITRMREVLSKMHARHKRAWQ